MTYPEGLGLDRGYIVTSDERGPDSIECTPGMIGGDENHSACFLDYSNLGGPHSHFGFICGCNCHDHEAWMDEDELAAMTSTERF